MSLQSLIRNAALGISLTLGCGSSENKFDRAFDNAQEQLKQQGIEVRGGLWNRERDYTLLFREMRVDLGDLETAVSRRNGANSCDEVGLSSYNSSTYYCGPGAVQGNCDRIAPGDCPNQVCLEHDLCVDDVLQESEDGQVCLWSSQTQRCDEQFFQGYDRCSENDNCGFYCQIIGVIALNLSTIEYAFDGIGPGCLWEGNYGQARIRDESKDKEPEYKEPKDEEDPEKEKKPEEKEIDWELRRLCSDFMDRMTGLDGSAGRCKVDYFPSQLEKLLGEGGCVSENTILERNRPLFECVYEKRCTDFRACVERY